MRLSCAARRVITPMMYYDEYQVPDREIDALLERAELGRLVTVGSDGMPHVGLYPFYLTDTGICLHLNRHDEQVADLERSARCAFEVDEVLATIPSHWLDAENGRLATAYHRCVTLECRSRVDTELPRIAEGQNRILRRYQPEGRYREVRSGDPLYEVGLEMLCAVSLGVEARRVKFKLAQNQPAELRRRVAARLRARGRPMDERAADALDSIS